MHFIPALLTASKQDLQYQLEKLIPHFTHFQVDIQDGIFVPSNTLSIAEYMEVITQHAKVTHLTLDFHLMLSDYEKALQDIAQISDLRLTIRTIFVHTNIDTKLFSAQTSITFNPEDEVRSWSDQLKMSKHAQVMTIHPGPQGQPFMANQLEKIGIIRSIQPHCVICIDGAVNDQTLGAIISQDTRCVPDECGVGSYFSKATLHNISTRLETLQALSQTK